MDYKKRSRANGIVRGKQQIYNSDRGRSYEQHYNAEEIGHFGKLNYMNEKTKAKNFDI